MEEVTLFCCGSAIIASLATFFWARSGSRRGRLYSAVFMGPAIAVLSAVFFHWGTLTYSALSRWRPLDLAKPSIEWDLFQWLRYSCISTVIPLILAIALMVTAVLVSGVGPHHAAAPLGGLEHFMTGSWLPDAFGCMALGSLFLGLVPYGLIYGCLGFILGTFARLTTQGMMSIQDPIAMLLMTNLVWVGSIVSAIKRK